MLQTYEAPILITSRSRPYGSPKASDTRSFAHATRIVWKDVVKKMRHAPSNPRKVACLIAMEAPGIEPGSRGTSASASTCVACQWLAGNNLATAPTAFVRPLPGKQGCVRTNQP